ncbi:aliphatic sulfonate ABC transporter substrate-binding protein [Clostridium sp. DJ247]|nr:aliphatic sulfonate ABC transporter substrate-binding protein [Clostridium sp. DJ247]
MKNIVSIVSLIAISAFLAVGCGKADAPKSTETKQSTTEKPQKIKIGYQPGINHTLLIVAKQQGWFDEEFKKDGIDVEFSSFVSGPPMVEAFAGNRLDIGQFGDQPAMQAKANNIDIKAIGVYSSGDKLNGLIVTNESNIKEPKDIKGKKVGVTVGSTGHTLLLKYLETSGLKQSDIKLVNLQPADIKTSLASKNIDAAVTWEPFVSAAEFEGSAHQIADGTNLKYDVNFIVVTNSFAKKYPDIVKRVLKIYDKSEKWVKANPDKAIELVSKDIGMKKEVLAKALPKENFDIRITDKITESASSTIKVLRANNTIRKDVNLNDLIDTSYLKDAGIQ